MAGTHGERVHAILLAAGESTRMGKLKALLPWVGGRPLLDYQVDQLLQTGVERVAVVLGHRAAELRARLPDASRLRVVHNPDYQSGKVSSIVAGVRVSEPAAHILILAVDQPRPADLIATVAAHHVAGGQAITIAGYGGRRGHPVVFRQVLRDELLTLDETTQGLRAVLQRHTDAIAVCETGSPFALVNLNTPEDYAAARRLAHLDEV